MPSVILSWPRVLASVRAYPKAVVRQAISDVLDAEPLLLPSIMASGGKQNVAEVLYLVLRESVQEAAADKRYYLRKIQAHNEMAAALRDYLAELVDASEQLSNQERGKKEEPYDCQSSPLPKSWLVGLPRKHIPIRLLNRK